MSDPDLAELLERAGAATPVSAPPLGAIAAGARRRRRLRFVGLSGVATATLAVVVALALALPGGPGAGGVRPAAPAGSPTGAAPAPDRGDLPSDAELADYVSRLEATVLPVLEELQVEYFMDEPGCEGITYDRAPPRDFTNGGPEHCGGSTDDPQPFDATVRADHARVAAALKESGTPIERTGGTFRDGELRGGFFMSTHRAPFATSWELMYDADAQQPRAPGGMVTIVAPVPGKPGWWFQCCSD
jgi:hypothetical protein